MLIASKLQLKVITIIIILIQNLLVIQEFSFCPFHLLKPNLEFYFLLFIFFILIHLLIFNPLN